LNVNRKQQYAELLLDDRWKRKRLIILKRDNHTCQHCGLKHNLQVHHLIYKVGGVPPWEYRNSDLITLCVNCHTEVHRTTKIKSVGYKQKTPPKSKEEKIKSRINKLKRTLSQNDLRIQEKYDKINQKRNNL
jgi:5-methylcytosine-specific restriction endonuclease McrA